MFWGVVTLAWCVLCRTQRVKRDLKRAISVLDQKKAMVPMSKSEVADLEATLTLSEAHIKQVQAKLTETRQEVSGALAGSRSPCRAALLDARTRTVTEAACCRACVHSTSTRVLSVHSCIKTCTRVLDVHSCARRALVC